MADVDPLVIERATPDLAGSRADLAGDRSSLAGDRTLDTGESISLTRWRPRAETVTYARQVRRAPYSTDWYVDGDGMRSAAQVIVDAFHIGSDVGAPTLDALLAMAADATSLRWGEYTRGVRGLAWHARTPTEIGDRVTLAFDALGSTWTNGLGAEVVL